MYIYFPRRTYRVNTAAKDARDFEHVLTRDIINEPQIIFIIFNFPYFLLYCQRIALK